MMIHRGHVINKMVDVYKKTIPVRSKNELIALLQVNYCLYLNVLYREICVEQCNVYFTVIKQVFHELWQFETRHANVRNLCAVLIIFLNYAGLRV